MKKVGFVFPGQGSQSVGMLAEIALHYPGVESTFREASVVLDYDLWRVVKEGPPEQLDSTVCTQPALLAASYAIFKILKEKSSIKPALLAGHSLGEYTALVCAEALSFQDGIKLVASRGRFMQDAVPEGRGALAAIVGLEDDVVKAICIDARQDQEVLAPANYNSIGQVVIAGDKIAVERAILLAKEKGARLAKILPVSVPSHCDLMVPAAKQLKQLLESLSIHQPTIPVLSNVDVALYETADAIRDGLVRQLFNPVQWVKTIQRFEDTGVTAIVECGPGKVLGGLIKRITPNITIEHTNELNHLQMLLETSSHAE